MDSKIMNKSIFVLLMSLLYLVFTAAGSINSSLVVYYPLLNSSNNYTDYSGNGLDGVAQGTPTFRQDNTFSRTVVFNDNQGDAFKAGWGNGVSMRSNLSYSMMVNCSTVNSGHDDIWTHGTSYLSVYLSQPTNFYYSSDAAHGHQVNANTDIVANVWYNLILMQTYNVTNPDKPIKKIYLDGVDVTVPIATSIVNDVNYNDDVGWGSLRGSPLSETCSFFNMAVWNRTLTESEILILNSTDGEIIVTNNVTITAYDNITLTQLSNFNAEVNGINYTTSIGLITLPFLKNESTLLNITVNATGYYNSNYTNHNTSIDLVAYLNPTITYNITYGNYIIYNGLNYTRNLSYSVNYICPPGSNTSISLFINKSKKHSENLTCNNNLLTITRNYSNNFEGHTNISIYFNTSYDPTTYNNFFGETNMTWDLENPSINLEIFVNNGFSSNVTNVSLYCNDTIFPMLNYSLYNTGNIFYFNNNTAGATINNQTEVRNGKNNITGYCFDPFGNTSKRETLDIYSSTIILWDEIDNMIFDVSNVTGAKAYFDDNSSVFNFKTEDTNTTFFISENTTKLRIELEYPESLFITRYIDVSLFDDEIKVCANKDDITHYEQLLISATETPVLLQNTYSNCMIAGDYTRFAYQDGLLLKAYSIDSTYFLRTVTDGQEVLLASLDGSIATFIQVDILAFKQTAYNLNILTDALSFEKLSGSNTTTIIYYENIANDNENINLVIENTDTGAIVFNQSEFSDPNKFTLYFDYSTINTTDMTLFKTTLTKTKTDGTISRVVRYFNTTSRSGVIPSAVAFTIAFLMTLFGLTMSVPRLSFSYLGVFVCILAIGILSFAVPAWYITFFMAIEIIALVYIIIIMVEKNYPTVG